MEIQTKCRSSCLVAQSAPALLLKKLKDDMSADLADSQKADEKDQQEPTMRHSSKRRSKEEVATADGDHPDESRAA